MSLESTKICIWCNKPLREGEHYEVIHVKEMNALGIAPESCFHELKERLSGGAESSQAGEAEPQPAPYYDEGYG